MQKRLLAVALTTMALGAPALADHNSKWGEGSANMPNDIHNTRIDTRGDNTAFRDFVRYGNGADSENRFSTSDSRAEQRRMSNTQRQRGTAGRSRGGRH